MRIRLTCRLVEIKVSTYNVTGIIIIVSWYKNNTCSRDDAVYTSCMEWKNACHVIMQNGFVLIQVP